MMLDKEYYIVTGSSSGLGENVVSNMKTLGFNTVGIDIVDGEGTDVKIDLSTLSKDNIDEIKQYLGGAKIKSIIHCAALQRSPNNNFESLSETFDEVFGVNIKSIYLFIKMLEDSFHAFSCVCLISSVHAEATSENDTLYASSKAALKGMLRGITLEKKDKMSIFELVLGAMNSPMLFNNLDKKELEELKNELPSKKILTTDEVANLIIDLVNNHASILHGSSIIVDNGVLSKLPTK